MPNSKRTERVRHSRRLAAILLAALVAGAGASGGTAVTVMITISISQSE